VEVNAQLAQQGDSRRLAVDGKTMRGAAKRGARLAHLLAAVSHQLKTVWGEVPVDQKTNEIPLFSALLRLLAVKGYLLTMDALLTQRDIAQQIIDSGNDYLMVVKDNQPQLLADIQGCFEAEPLADEVRGQAQTTTKDHGRLGTRNCDQHCPTSISIGRVPGGANQPDDKQDGAGPRPGTGEQITNSAERQPQLLAANRGLDNRERALGTCVVMGKACAVHKAGSKCWRRSAIPPLR
jgi:predicted transposase YbfD/YdcC